MFYNFLKFIFRFATVAGARLGAGAGAAETGAAPQYWKKQWCTVSNV